MESQRLPLEASPQLVDTPRVVEPPVRLVSALRRPPAALLATVVVGAIVYGGLSQLVDMPLLNPDELRYTLAARGIADGEWLNLRGHAYGFGPVYPFVVAPLIALAGGMANAYPFVKLANALLFALAAVPIYFIARRLLSEWWSVGVAALCLTIPSSIYTSLVLTESAAYLASSTALLAVVLALERATVPRQLALIGAVALAVATRPQFAAFLPAFLAGALLLWAIDAARQPFRRAAAGLWPTLAFIGATAAIAVARVLVTNSSPEGSFGGYADLWREYDPWPVARFAIYHLAAWELYLFVVPFAVAPIVLVDLLSAARRGAERAGAFAAAFLTVNLATVLIAGAFASTPYGYLQLHDRYVFYVAPLWVVCFAVWLARGMPRPMPLTAGCLVLALVLPAILPFGLIGGGLVIEVVPTALWSWIWTAVEGTPQLDGRRVLGLCVVGLVVATAAVPRRAWPVLPALVAAGMVLTAGLAWGRETREPAAFTLAAASDRTWVDDTLPSGARVAKLYLSPPACPYTELTRHALFLTELFNGSIDRVAAIGDSASDGLPIERVDIGPGGLFVATDGKPLVADYVVTQPELTLRGRRITRATGADLVLWETRGRVALADASLRENDVVLAHCR